MSQRNPIILFIDPVSLTRDALLDQFRYYDFVRLLEAGTLDQALNCIREEKPDLVLLHPPLADMDSKQVLSALRQNGLEVPVIVIGETLSNENNHVAYTAKPLRVSALMSRVRSMIAAYEQHEDAVLLFSGFRLVGQILETGSGESIPVTEMEAGILRYLHKADGKRISREELLSEIWGYNPQVRTHTLATHIHRLRQKIEDDPSNPLILLTRKNGYVLLHD